MFEEGQTLKVKRKWGLAPSFDTRWESYCRNEGLDPKSVFPALVIERLRYSNSYSLHIFKPNTRQKLYGGNTDYWEVVKSDKNLKDFF
jgi:hypothetical protein